MSVSQVDAAFTAESGEPATSPKVDGSPSSQNEGSAEFVRDLLFETTKRVETTEIRGDSFPRKSARDGRYGVAASATREREAQVQSPHLLGILETPIDIS